MYKLNVLISGRSRKAVDTARDLLADNDRCRTKTKVITNGQMDPLAGLDRHPDLLILCDLQCEEEMQSLAAMPPAERPALLVFGAGDDPAAIRLAMRAGARDYLTLPLDEQELNTAVDQVAADLAETMVDDSGDLHVFVNGKGGSGATFLATNVAHGLASSGKKVTLVDLDLQFAGLCRYLDLAPANDLLEAVHAIDDMDEISAEAFTSKHDSGLRLLSGKGEKLHLTSDIEPERIVGMLQAYQSFNDYVIVDLPRHIDVLSAAVLENADRITVVTQQSFPHLHDTARLLQIMREDLGIRDSQLTVVVNRYVKDSPILMKDIENTLRVQDIVRIPNHYRVTAESINTGIPLSQLTQKAAVSRGVRDFYRSIAGEPANDESMATRAFQSLFRR
jgi:pilus assembly protein CpaE